MLDTKIRIWRVSQVFEKFDAWWEEIGETVGENPRDTLRACTDLFKRIYEDETIGGVVVPVQTTENPAGEPCLFLNPRCRLPQAESGSAKIKTELKTKDANGVESSKPVILNRQWDYSGPTKEGAEAWGTLVPRPVFSTDSTEVVMEFPEYTALGLVDDHRFWEVAIPLPHATAPGVARPTQMVWVPPNPEGNAALVSRYNVTYEAWNEFAKNSENASAVQKVVSDEKLLFPVVEVCFWDCVNFAEWAGFQIPTQPDWVFASRGDDTRDFPWGNEEPCEGLVQTTDDVDANVVPTPSGYLSAKRPAGHGRYGVIDKCGNAWEWTSTPHDPS
jgi:hypothetical protein